MPKSEKQSESISPPGKNGGKRPGAGRKPGVRNKKTAEVIQAVEETGETPLQYMLRVMRDREADENRRDSMAASAAPYVHPKLANLNHSGELTVKGLSDDELALARDIFTEIARRQSGDG
jgi:hypothetical protein